MRSRCSDLLKALLPLILLAAALDSAAVVWAQDHRSAEAGLFLESGLLWLVFGVCALFPAVPSLALMRRGARIEREAPTPWAVAAGTLGGWLVFPVLAHDRLDSATTIGQDVSGLLQPGPWLQVGALALGLALGLPLGLRYLGPLLSRVPGRAAAALAILLALPIGLGVWTSERVTEQPSRVQAAPGSPNLLFLVWDTTRAQSLSTYGHERETTPFLSGFAKQCMQLDEARSVSCFTLTSHLSMLTGVYPSEHGASLSHMIFNPRKTPTVARLLHDAGYRTGGFVGTGVLRARTGIVDGFEVYDDRVDPAVCDTRAWSLVHDVQAVLARLHPAFANNGLPHWIEDFQRPAEDVLNAALDWIREDDPRPWFCFVNLYDVHWPYLPGDVGRERFVAPLGYQGDVDGYVFRSDQYSRPPGVQRGSQLDAADRAQLLGLYEGELFELDALVGAFVQNLDLRAGGTAVVLTSDHGESFGEAGRFEHDDITEPQVRVPFLVYSPQDDPARHEHSGRVAGRTSGIDVASTLLGLAGLPQPENMRGLDLLAERPGEDRAILIEDRDRLQTDEMHFALYRGSFKLVQTGLQGGARFELFDLSVDAVGMIDVGQQQPEVLARMTAELRELRQEWGGGAEQFQTGGRLSAHLTGLGYGGGQDVDVDAAQD